MSIRSRRALFLLWSFVTVVLPLGGAVWAQEGPRELSEAERFVLNKVKAGRLADLGAHFGENESKRVLGADFLVNLLTGELENIAIHRSGVRIYSAVINERLILKNAVVPYEVQLVNCTFNGTVNMGGAHFHSHLSLSSSKVKLGIFSGIKVGGNASFELTVFKHRGSFNDGEVAGNFLAARVKFHRAQADFRGIKIGQNADFLSAKFGGPTNFEGAEIAGDFRALQAIFTNKKASADFKNMKVGGRAVFKKVLLGATANFSGAEINGDFIADGSKFFHKKEPAEFGGILIGNSVYFRGVVFEGPVNFEAAEIGNDFVVDNAKFLHQERAALFTRIRVGNNALLRKTEFSGPVYFTDAMVKNRLVADKAKFTHPEILANFNGVIIEGPASFRKTRFNGSLSIAKAQLMDLLIGESDENESTQTIIKEIDLSQTHIRRELQIQNVHIGKMVTPFLRVEGPTIFSGVNISDEANLEHVRFLTLELEGVRWPESAENTPAVKLEGLTYKRIIWGNVEDGWRETLEWVKNSVYSAQPFTQLEGSFRAEGYPERADEVYVEMKIRERKELAFLSPGWCASWLLEKLVRYGRSPHWAFYWSTGVVFIGMLMFWREKDVQPKDPKDMEKRYNPFWYSLDLFLPFIDLQAADIWLPRQDSQIRRNYARVHTILGWILVPVGLAAITGIIK